MDDDDTLKLTIRMFLEFDFINKFHIPYDVSMAIDFLLISFSFICKNMDVRLVRMLDGLENIYSWFIKILTHSTGF